MTTVGILGMGSMGAAIFQALRQHILPEKLLVFDRNADKLSDAQSVQICENIQSLTEQADVLIVAVKPQGFTEVPFYGYQGVLISIMSGISMQELQRHTGTRQVVRVMPNLPLQVGQGMTIWVCGDKVQDKEAIHSLLLYFGEELELSNEEELDRATGICGSGPAYFYYFTELLAAAAQEQGFTAEQAQKLAVHTFTGSAALLSQSTRTPAQWRAAVTSKKGVTEAAIEHLQTVLPGLVVEAVERAYTRTKELSK